VTNRARGQRRPGTVSRTVALGAAVLFAVTACGGSGDPAAANADELTPVRVLLAPVYAESVRIADDKGYFEDEGLDVELVEGSTADAQIPQLLNGQAQFGMSAGVAMVAAVAEGIPVTITLGDQSATVTDPLTSGILVKQDSPIQSYGDLAGKTVGLQSLQDTTQLAVMLAVEEAGADPESVQFVNVPLPTLNDALSGGQVDAIYNIGAFYGTGVQTGFREVGSAVADALVTGPSVVFAASKAYAKENPDTVKAFNAAMTKAFDDVTADPELIRQVQLEHSNQPPEYIKTAPVAPVGPDIDESGMQKTIDGMVAYGFITEEPSFDDVVSDLCPTVP
jgi:NitT/TauT family transport system substrate-binding protein